MSAEPVVTPAFTMIGSDAAAACEGDACAVAIPPATDTVVESSD
ncbi:hypothetical protein [Williamsia maris]|uniref:Uncharacterized protein n=1 Tax=Williamsia maris TaxID=72806 RepID=A0ABT1HAM5_9NOCA|nr:hypothetical protein [Williamsia maris]MCP2175303.1 hypothetical protein [Williamsia maris]